MSSPEPALAVVRPGPRARAERPLRADAQRNREKLLTAARASFAAARGTVPLEDIARAAGVGIGTLYRHFPTRESLVEQVYAAELDHVTTSAHTLLEQFPPDVALQAWVQRYADFAATKRGMVDTLRPGWAAGRVTTPTTRERITAAIGLILTAGARAGSLRADVHPEDVTAILLGIFLSTPAHANSEQTGRLLALVLDALRPPPHP